MTTDDNPHAPVRALLVDDVAAERRRLRELLAGVDDPALTLAEAASVAELHAARAQEPFDVYLLDLRLPDGDGVGAARRILAEQPDAVVVMLTAFPDRRVDRAAEEAGVAAFIPKDQAGTAELQRAIRYGLRRRRDRHALADAEERFRAAFEAAPIGMALCSLTGRFLKVNRALCVLTGYAPRRLERVAMEDITHPDDIPGDREDDEALLAGDVESYAKEKRILNAGGQPVWVSVHATLVRDTRGRPVNVLRQVQDVSARRRFEQQLKRMADHDPLTGLPNRRSFARDLERHVAGVRRYGADGAVLVLDLDQFKAVNDTLGHNAGDELIVAVAGRLRGCLRATDVLARLGGDEFAVLVPRGGHREAADVAQKLLAALRADTQLGRGVTSRVTASVGVATVDDPSLTADELLVNADLAMYDAKEEGRDRLAFYRDDEHLQPRIKARLTWMQRIEHALDHDRFVLHAQPILDMRTGDISHHELLLRMLTLDGDLVPPGTFLYIAERFDLVRRIDRWVTERAVQVVSRRATAGAPVALTVNLSGKTLADEGFLPALEGWLANAAVPPASLTFELTETAAVANIPLARRFADRLHELGCRFALDDFGAGFGSFYYLKYLPFDYLKIDGEFVRHCVSSRADQVIVKAVVDIARGLGKETVGEFTEDRTVLSFLRDHGVDYAQGHHVGMPMPLEDALPVG